MVSATVFLALVCLGLVVIAGIVSAVIVVYQWPRSRDDENLR